MKINVNLIDINFFEDFKNKIRSLSKHLIYFVFDRIAKYYRDILLFFFLYRTSLQVEVGLPAPLHQKL